MSPYSGHGALTLDVGARVLQDWVWSDGEADGLVAPRDGLHLDLNDPLMTFEVVRPKDAHKMDHVMLDRAAATILPAPPAKVRQSLCDSYAAAHSCRPSLSLALLVSRLAHMRRCLCECFGVGSIARPAGFPSSRK